MKSILHIVTISTVCALILGAGWTAPTALAQAGANPPAPSAVHTVCPTGPPDCDFDNLQQAVDAAGPGDLIKVAAGTYSHAQFRPAPAGYRGPATIRQVLYLSKTVTLQGGYTLSNWLTPDPQANPTTLDALGQGRPLFIAGDVQPVVSGFRLTGGDASGLGGSILSDPAGGGVYILSATATLSNNLVYSNTTGPEGDGGGMFVLRNRSTLRRNTVQHNSAGANGGGICMHNFDGVLADNLILSNTGTVWAGGLYLADSPGLFEKNVIRGNETAYGCGLAVFSCDAAILRENTIVHNSGIAAGGMYFGYTGWTTRALVISNTIAYNKVPGSGGGGYLIYAPSDFIGNTIAHNTAEDFGGFYTFSSEALFAGNTFYDNTAAGEAGGLYLEYSPATLRDNSFVENEAAIGGGLYMYGCDAGLYGNRFISNSATYGGGANLTYSPADLVGNEFTFNQASYGAGLALEDSTANLDGNRFLHNRSSAYGGGLLLNQSDATLRNNLVADNQAQQAGSGLLISDASPHLLHNTIAHNTGGDGCGVYVTHVERVGSAPVLSNTILVSHSLGVHVTAGSSVRLEATLWGAGPWANESDWGGAGLVYTGTTNLWEPPAFVDPAQGDYHLDPGSAAIDAGLPGPVETDIDGQPRPIGSGPDLGADEFPAALQLHKYANSAEVPAGAALTYTLLLSNSGVVPLNAVLSDWLPEAVSPTGLLSWTAQLTPGGCWSRTLTIRTAGDYRGPLTNTLEATTAEGLSGWAWVTVQVVDTPLQGLEAHNDGPSVLGGTTTLSATVEAGSDAVYAWALGDGTYGSGPLLTHTYPTVGTYTARVTASNDVSTLQATTIVTIEPAAPIFRRYLPLVLRVGNH